MQILIFKLVPVPKGHQFPEESSIFHSGRDLLRSWTMRIPNVLVLVLLLRFGVEPRDLQSHCGRQGVNLVTRAVVLSTRMSTSPIECPNCAYLHMHICTEVFYHILFYEVLLRFEEIVFSHLWQHPGSNMHLLTLESSMSDLCTYDCFLACAGRAYQGTWIEYPGTGYPRIVAFRLSQ